ncbi:HEPN domain-containing protein [Qipengyuania sp. DGS5-3]|uniref:HEPN domain-containing protein n=1 Tax=Qipengyuania sp. DGS5-3 TaxID=3349632 RepID=UPI0036D37A8E
MKLAGAAELLHATVDEVEQNAEFVDCAMSYVADSAQLIFAHDDGGPLTKTLKGALELRRTQPAAVFRGLIVQIVAAFEEYVRNFCNAQITLIHTRINDQGGDLNSKLRLTYLSKAGKILGQLPTGTFLGAKFDFPSLENTLSTVLKSEKPIELQPEVFSTRIGNCNSEKLVEIFEWFDLKQPFRKELGSHTATLNWRNGSASPTAVAGLMKRELDDLIDLRNDLAHGEPRTVSIDSVKNGAQLVKALATAFSDLADVDA